MPMLPPENGFTGKVRGVNKRPPELLPLFAIAVILMAAGLVLVLHLVVRGAEPPRDVRLPERQPDRQVVLSFGADWCPNCRALDRTWRQIAAQPARLPGARIPIDVDGMTAEQRAEWKITAVPVTILGERLPDGSIRELRRLNGAANAAQLRTFLERAQ